jgi:hypothetical protein
MGWFLDCVELGAAGEGCNPPEGVQFAQLAQVRQTVADGMEGLV